MTRTLYSLNKSLLETLSERFQGDFDNFDQVVDDRRNNFTPRQGGGHEHFHVTLIPVPIQDVPIELFASSSSSSSCACVIAGYYFDGRPEMIFRLRFYTMQTQGNNVLMKLYTFDKELDQILRNASYDSAGKWLGLFRSYVKIKSIGAFKELERCDVLWANEPDVIRQKYLIENEIPKVNNFAIHAVMIHDHDKGGVLLKSQMNADVNIRIQDELSLWEDELWVNDRGHDAESKTMVYGNWKGIPYKLKRVSSFKYTADGTLQRHHLSWNLNWTLGPTYRTQIEYDEKMKSIGGVSSEMNRKT